MLCLVTHCRVMLACLEEFEVGPSSSKKQAYFLSSHSSHSFLLVNKPSLVLSFCKAPVLHVQSGSQDVASWNWILHGAPGKGGKILEWNISVAKERIVNLGLWGWDAPGCHSEGPCLSRQTTPPVWACWGSHSPLKSANGLKIGPWRDLVWVECSVQKQHSCPFLKSCVLKCWWLLLLSVVSPVMLGMDKYVDWCHVFSYSRRNWFRGSFGNKAFGATCRSA